MFVGRMSTHRGARLLGAGRPPLTIGRGSDAAHNRTHARLKSFAGMGSKIGRGQLRPIELSVSCRAWTAKESGPHLDPSSDEALWVFRLGEAHERPGFLC